MKDFNHTATNVGQVIVAIDALVQRSASKAYILHINAAQALPIGVKNASYQGQDAASIRVAVDDAELENYVASAGSVVEVVVLPDSAAARAKLLTEWAKKIAKKNKVGLVPLLLLPLAACGGGDSDAPAPALTFVVTENVNEVSFGGTVSGDITVDLSNAIASFVRGGVTAATSVIDLFDAAAPKELVIAAGQTVVIDGGDVNGGSLKASGAGTLSIRNMEDSLAVDLGDVSTSFVLAQIDTTGGVTFLASADLGSAIVTVSGVQGVTTDKVAFLEGAELSGATFMVEVGALLELTATQMDAVSGNGAITGAGDVRVIIPSATVNADSISALVKVDLEGGTLTFDLADDLDTLVLSAGSSIDLGGGTLIIDDGTVDILTNATDFTNVGNVVVNSGLTLSVSQLQQLSGTVQTQGEGRLDVKVTSAEDVATLQAIIGDLVTAGSVPQLSVSVASTATDTVGIDAALASGAASISSAAGVTVPVTNSSIEVLKVGVTLSVSASVSKDTTPTISIELPNTDGTSSVQDGDIIRVFVDGVPVYEDTLDGTEPVGGYSFTMSDAAPLTEERQHLVTAEFVRSGAAILSNELRYTLDLTPPDAPTVVGVSSLSDGVMNAADADGAFVRVELPANAAKGDVVTLKLGFSDFATASLGASQLSDGYVDFLVTAGTLGVDGTKVFTAFLTDSVENVGSASQVFTLTLDTVVAAPTISKIAGNDVINIGEETSTLSGTNEIGASVAVSFGGVAKVVTMVGTTWSYQLTTADIAAMGQGAETIFVRQTDAAGNVSAIATREIQVDTVNLTVAKDETLTLTAAQANDRIITGDGTVKIIGKIGPDLSIDLTRITASLDITSAEFESNVPSVFNIANKTFYTSLKVAVEDALPGNELFLTAGTFNDVVTIDKDITLTGANFGKSAKFMEGNTADTDAIGAAFKGDGDAGERGSETLLTGKITVASENVKIDGVKFDSAAPLAWEISVLNTEGGSLDGFTLTNSIMVGYTAAGAPRFSPEDGTAGNYAGATRASTWELSDNMFGGMTTGNSGALYISGVGDIDISDNLFWRPSAGHMYLSSLKDATIEDNFFFHGLHAGGANFDGYGARGDSPLDGYGGYGYGGAAFGRNFWIELKGINDGITISGNDGQFNSGGIQLFGEAGQEYTFDNIVISDNIFRDFVNAAPKGGLAAGKSGFLGAISVSIDTESAKGLKIQDNEITVAADQIYRTSDLPALIQLQGLLEDTTDVSGNTLKWVADSSQQIIDGLKALSADPSNLDEPLIALRLVGGLDGNVDVMANTFEADVSFLGNARAIEVVGNTDNFGKFVASLNIGSEVGKENEISGDYGFQVLFAPLPDGFNPNNLSIGTALTDLVYVVDSGVAKQLIFGTSGDDNMIGTLFNDIIIGGLGADTLTGGGGADTFVFNSGDTGVTVVMADKITDFVRGEDKLKFVELDAGESSNFVGATIDVSDFDAALASANDALTGSVVFSYQFDKTSGFLFIDRDINGSADEVIIFEGLKDGGVLHSDIIA